MSLLTPLVVLLAASAPAPPTVSLEASPEAVVLSIANPRPKALLVADPRDVDGLPYSLMFIKVVGPDGEPVWDGKNDGWWTPLFMRSQIDMAVPEAWPVAAGTVSTVSMGPKALTRGLRGPKVGSCRFQAKAVVRDREAWPWSDGGAYEAESEWVEVPCAALF